MTTDERFARIEHVTAALAEERRKDRDEYKALWRDTQRQISQLGSHVDALAVETRLRLEELGDRIETANAQLGARIETVNTDLGARIGQMVSGIGQFMAEQRDRDRK